MRHASRWLVTIYGLCTIAFLVLPVLSVVPLSFEDSPILLYPVESFSTHWYAQVFASDSWRQAFENSLFVTPGAMVIAVIVGTLAALALHGARFRGRGIIATLVVLPAVVPPVMLGLGVYLFATPMHLAHDRATMLFLHATLGIPFVTLSVLASLARMDKDLVRVSETLGASAWFTFRRITWPAIVPGMAAGAVITLAISADEVIASDFLSTPQTMTISLRLLQGVTRNLSPDVAVVATLLVLVSVLAAGTWVAVLLMNRGETKDRT